MAGCQFSGTGCGMSVETLNGEAAAPVGKPQGTAASSETENLAQKAVKPAEAALSPVGAPRSKRLGRIMLGLPLPLILLLAWHLITVLHLAPPQLLTPPASVFFRLWDMTMSGKLWLNLRSSLSLVVVGFLWGSMTGILVGTLMATSKIMDRIFHPVINAVRLVPLFGWLPFLILLLGIGREFKIFFVGLSAFYVMVVNAYEGVRSVPPEFLEVSRIFGLGYFRRFFQVILPEALPYFFTGFKTGLSLSWMTVVGAEMVASSIGVGYVMSFSRTMFQYATVYAMVIVIGVTGFLMNLVLNWLERRALYWRYTYIKD
jgi:sulfonate transport system permease protein